MFWYVVLNKSLIALHHGDNNFLFWHLYQTHTFNNNLSNDKISIDMCYKATFLWQKYVWENKIIAGKPLQNILHDKTIPS